MRNVIILIILVMLSSCAEDRSDYVAKTSPKELCVVSCVKRMLWNVDEVGGSAVKDLRDLCESKFTAVKCCKSFGGSYDTCD